MDIQICRNSANGNAGCSRRYMKNDHDRFEYLSLWVLRSKTVRWRVLWRKIMKEKKKFFGSHSNLVHVPYDPYTYSQNFDQGSTWADPDDLSRSFSARFAVPSRIFEKNGLMG
ncbi:hypothetical protein L1049_004222 [Liquidambar formosana]|uniref:Uncharacterized protein n=1 Tax=Liquidambar formosana TaxID=63359 RepID=A0AAP0RP46_LIQFO